MTSAVFGVELNAGEQKSNKILSKIIKDESVEYELAFSEEPGLYDSSVPQFVYNVITTLKCT